MTVVLGAFWHVCWSSLQSQRELDGQQTSVRKGEPLCLRECAIIAKSAIC